VSPRISQALREQSIQHIIGLTSALTQTDGTGQRSSLARMASADLVQTKGLGLTFIVFGKISLDRRLPTERKMPRRMRCRVILGEEVLHRIEPGCRGRGEVKGPPRMARQPGQHFRMLVGGVVSRTTWIDLSAATSRSTVLRKRMNSLWRWRCMQRPMTVPSSRLSAANRVVVPCRL